MDNQADKRVTIDKIAELSGVSKTTISRFLNHKYENISLETRKRIAAVIEETGYRPNRSAQRLKSGKTMLIGCCIGDVSSPFTGLLLKGITTECESAGYQVLFADCGENPQRERAAIKDFIDNRVDGLLVNTPGENEDLLTHIYKQGIPVALSDRGLPKDGVLDTASNNNEELAGNALRFLKDCGYTKVAFFTEGNRKVMPRILRQKGYEKVFRELFPGIEPLVCVFDRLEEGSCAGCVNRLREAYPGERIACIAVNGVTAKYVLRALRDLGIETGYDFGFCTFDDWSWFNLMNTGITAIALNTEKIGSAAAKMLLERLDGTVALDAPGRDVYIRGRLHVRGSTVADDSSVYEKYMALE